MLRAISGMCEGLKNGGNARVQFPIIEVMRQRNGPRSRGIAAAQLVRCGINVALHHPPPTSFFRGRVLYNTPLLAGRKNRHPCRKKFLVKIWQTNASSKSSRSGATTLLHGSVKSSAPNRKLGSKRHCVASSPATAWQSNQATASARQRCSPG